MDKALGKILNSNMFWIFLDCASALLFWGGQCCTEPGSLANRILHLVFGVRLDGQGEKPVGLISLQIFHFLWLYSYLFLHSYHC